MRRVGSACVPPRENDEAAVETSEAFDIQTTPCGVLWPASTPRKHTCGRKNRPDRMPPAIHGQQDATIYPKRIIKPDLHESKIDIHRIRVDSACPQAPEWFFMLE
jgi:hypothetical protein